MIFIDVLWFVDSRHKVNPTCNLDPSPTDIHSEALSSELAVLAQELPSILILCMRGYMKAHKHAVD